MMRPHPKGKEPGAFGPIAIANGSATWEDPAIEFPRRIVYEHLAPDTLNARIEGKRSERAIAWRMGRWRARGVRRRASTNSPSGGMAGEHDTARQEQYANPQYGAPCTMG
ncbi:MAG: hypothetical protein M3081_16120 [Gemmatimonadota bacterium]|nr:hypothetical protein [Gemmatimonadota bacterium]